jgi:hypothetical protein
MNAKRVIMRDSFGTSSRHEMTSVGAAGTVQPLSWSTSSFPDAVIDASDAECFVVQTEVLTQPRQHQETAQAGVGIGTRHRRFAPR